MTRIHCPGFHAAGMAAGIKKNHQPDLGLICATVPASAAGVFTRNRVKAAPVILSESRLRQGRIQAIVANSGNANCCTGDQGMADARQMTERVAAATGLVTDQVLVASTGVIGQPMPMDVIGPRIGELAQRLSEDGFADFARAIMTTDTVPKLEHRQIELDGRPVTLVAAAKGAGMIRPDMATMLCFVCTDAKASAGYLQTVLKTAVDGSFNCITIDGDTSTNDMVTVMANGVSGVSVEQAGKSSVFEQALTELLIDLARQLVKDGEGVTKVVEIRVAGAASHDAAQAVAQTVAHSPLVKTAFYGQDANWGRIMGAVGRAGVAVDPDRIDVFFDKVRMVRNGMGCGAAAEAEATKVMRKDEFGVTIDLKNGPAEARMLTCDLSVDYVKINADYRS